MVIARDNIEDYIRNAEFILRVQSTIDFSLKWICVTRHHKKDYMRNEEFIERAHSTIDSSSKWMHVACDNIRSYETWSIYMKSLFNNSIHFEVSECDSSQCWRSHEKWRIFIISPFKSWLKFEVNGFSSYNIAHYMKSEAFI